jgi:hypothetical protein
MIEIRIKARHNINDLANNLALLGELSALHVTLRFDDTLQSTIEQHSDEVRRRCGLYSGLRFSL